MIGTESAIRDDVALLFADWLHRGLARGERVGDGFDAARAAVKTHLGDGPTHFLRPGGPAPVGQPPRDPAAGARHRAHVPVADAGGRAGRALTQTWHPHLPQAAVNHDHARFADGEPAEGKAFGWPPFTRAAMLRFEGRDADRVAELAHRAESVLRRAGVGHDGTVLRGPAPAVLERLRGRTRWALMITAPRVGPLHRLLGALDAASLPRAGEPRMIVDVDPHDLM